MQPNNQILRNPVARALQILGDRSSMMIMRDVFLGRHRFKQFLEHSNLTKGTLTARLESLVANEVLCKKMYSEKPPRYEYRLTSKGKGLYSWALMIWQWESEWANNQEIGLPKNLTHNHDGGHVLLPVCLCRYCKTEVTKKNVKVVPIEIDESELDDQDADQNIGKQRRVSGTKVGIKDNSLSHLIEIIGDRWSSLIVGANLLGFNRFEDYQLQLGIASNVLAARLKVLTSLGVFDRVEYQVKPTRYEYRLSRKGRALYGQTMALRQWVLDYFPQVKDTQKLVHLECDTDLNVDVVCKICCEVPNPGDVDWDRKALS